MHAFVSPEISRFQFVAASPAAQGRFRPISDTEARRLEEKSANDAHEDERKIAEGCPRIVPLKLWQETFPPDRSEIKRLAAQHYRRGASAVESFSEAQHQHLRSSLLGSSRTRSAFEHLSRAFGGAITPAVDESLLRAAASLWQTAALQGKHILNTSAGQRPTRRKMLEQAWLRRGWCAAAGACLLSGETKREGAKSFPRYYNVDGVREAARDWVNPDYLGRLPDVAETYSRLLVVFSYIFYRQDRASLRASEAADRLDPDDADSFLSWEHDFGDVQIRPVPPRKEMQEEEISRPEEQDTSAGVVERSAAESASKAEADFEDLIT